MIGVMEEFFGKYWLVGAILLVWALRVVLGAKKFTLKNLTKRLVYLPKFAFKGVWSERFILCIIIVAANYVHWQKDGFSIKFLLASLVGTLLMAFIFLLFGSLFVTDIEEEEKNT